MNALSKDMKKKEAVEALAGLANAEDVIAFTLGDDRHDVSAAAEVRLQELEDAEKQSAQPPAPETTPAAAIASGAGDPLKQGQQSGPITRAVQDFKHGIQAVKSFITGADIVADIDAADRARVDREEKEGKPHPPITGETVMAAVDEADAKRADELARKAAEDEKARKAGKTNPDVVTAETVIKRMRAEGVKI